VTGESFAFSIAPSDHWNLVDCIVILSTAHKQVGSAVGMRRAFTSPLQKARLEDSKRRLDLCRSAIIHRDFDALAQVAELDSNLMHAVMMTSDPPLFYWQPETLAVMQAVRSWQGEGLAVTYTIDAGPNVHVICTESSREQVLARVKNLPGVIEVLSGGPAGSARLVD
jgi:diphosphomevalonate decarboxylase